MSLNDDRFKDGFKKQKELFQLGARIADVLHGSVSHAASQKPFRHASWNGRLLKPHDETEIAVMYQGHFTKGLDDEGVVINQAGLEDSTLELTYERTRKYDSNAPDHTLSIFQSLEVQYGMELRRPLLHERESTLLRLAHDAITHNFIPDDRRQY